MDKLKNSWNIYPPKIGVAKALEMRRAVHENNFRVVQIRLSDPAFSRSLVVMRGKNNEYLDLLRSGFDLLIEEQFGETIDLEDIAPEELRDFLAEKKIPEQILNEIAHVAFHQRDAKRFEALTKIILEHKELWRNPQIVARAQHDLATWLGIHGDFAGAIENNKLALTEAEKLEEKVIAAKARFGLTFYKGFLEKGTDGKELLKPRDQVDDLIKVAETMDELGVYYDAIRARVEAARMMIALAMRQEDKLKADTLKTAKDLALDVLKKAKDLQYPNAEIIARHILSIVYRNMGDRRKDASFQKNAQQLVADFGYNTELFDVVSLTIDK